MYPAPTHPDTVLEPEISITPRKKRSRVLIVDDEAGHSEALSEALARQGFLTNIAQTGAEALDQLRRTPFDLVLLDVGLPDTDGLDVCQKIVDDPQTCTVPVIIISGTDRPSIVREARAAGSHYFVRKPYDPNALLLLAQTAIDDCQTW